MKEIKEEDDSFLREIEREFRSFGFLNKSNCSFALVGRDVYGYLISDIHKGLICLSRLASLNISEFIDEFYFLDSIYKQEDISEELSFEYFQFVYNLSMFKGIFYKDETAETAYNRGYTVIKSSTPSNLLAFFVTMRRAIWEFDGFGSAWETFVDLGADPKVAFILAHYYKGISKGNIFSSSVENSNHSIFNSYSSSLEEARIFINGFNRNELYEPLRYSTKYKGILNLIGGREEGIKIHAVLESTPKNLKTYKSIFQPNIIPKENKESSAVDILNHFTKNLGV